MNQKQISYFENLKDKNIHILGFLGREGMAVLNCLYNKGIRNITAHDFSKKEDAKHKFELIQTALKKEEKDKEYQNLLNKEITFCYMDNYLNGIDKADVVYVSQNWYTYAVNKPLSEELKKREIRLTCIMDMYFELSEFPIIGITGSNGKTTTTNIIYQILKECTNKKLLIAGNDTYAKPVVEEILNYGKDEAILVLEISNRHLKMFNHKPHIAVLTNLSKNHIAEHGGWEGYVHDKANIFRHMNNGYTILNGDDKNTSMIIDDVKNQLVLFSKSKVNNNKCYSIFVDNGKIFFNDNKSTKEICSINDVKIPGEHNLENALAGLAAVILMKTDISKLASAMRNYIPVKERLQLVTTFNGVRYYNDISCTTPQSAEYALKTLSEGKRNIIHITGGEDKEMEFTELNKLINKEVKKLIAFPGTGTKKILADVNPELVEHFNNINVALDYIYEIAKSGDIVLLSPGLAFFKREYLEPKSFDDYVFEMIKRKSNM